MRRYDLRCVYFLVKRGSSLTEVDEDGCTPMHLALDTAIDVDPESSIEMLKILLTADEDERAEALCCIANDGLTPFHQAAGCGSSELMGLLLDSVDEEILTDVLEMRSHLKGGLYNGQWGKKAADGELAELDVEHMTLLHLAVEHLDPKTKLSLDADEEDEVDPLSGAARVKALEVVRLLIERGADVNASDANGRRPIHQAVAAGLLDVAELLLKAGADPSLGCKAIGAANTALHQAVMAGDADMTRLLLRASPNLDANVKGKNGMTPLCLAARSNKEDCARALVDGGADPRVENASGKSAVDIARTNRQAAILKLFGEEC